MNKLSHDFLFAGEVEPFGGLSNETDLVSNIPPDFKKSNDWSSYAEACAFGKVKNTKDWKWKASIREQREEKMKYFTGLLQSVTISAEEKFQIAGWMLSNILTEVPPLSE